MSIKSFNDLIEKVHKPGISQECGGCVSFCNSLENKIIEYKKPNSLNQKKSEQKKI